ncbi:MAG: hypothetical protein V1688_02635 [bacterium]
MRRGFSQIFLAGLQELSSQAWELSSCKPAYFFKSPLLPFAKGGTSHVEPSPQPLRGRGDACGIFLFKTKKYWQQKK